MAHGSNNFLKKPKKKKPNPLHHMNTLQWMLLAQNVFIFIWWKLWLFLFNLCFNVKGNAKKYNKLCTLKYKLKFTQLDRPIKFTYSNFSLLRHSYNSGKEEI